MNVAKKVEYPQKTEGVKKQKVENLIENVKIDSTFLNEDPVYFFSKHMITVFYHMEKDLFVESMKRAVLLF